MAANSDRATSSVASVERDLTLPEAEAILRGLAGMLVTAEANRPLGPPPLSPDRTEPQKEAPDPITRSSTDMVFPQPRILSGEREFRALLAALPDALILIDGAGRIVQINSQAESLFGYERGELLGQSIERLVPERFGEMHMAERASFLAEPHLRPMGKGPDLLAHRKDGRDIPVEINLGPLQTDRGLLVVATVRDIRARKHAEAQLRKMEARYRSLVEGIPAVTFMAALDEGANELYVSPQIEELLGFSQNEWLENPVLWYTQLHPDDRFRWHEEFSRTCSTGEPFSSVYRFTARDGRVVWVRGEAKVVRDGEGQPMFLQGVAFDITAIKDAEAGLISLNQTLEQRVAERTAIAEHRAEELERSNAALEQFGYIIAHDLRQPLRTIKSYSQKLAERHQGRLDAESDDCLTRTNNAADRMRVLIDDLLAYSRVGTQGKSPVPVDCSSAVAAACGNLQADILECGAQVTADPLPSLMADETQIAQLFQNLISNALKFRTGETPRVHVHSRREDGRCLICVTDNGIGIEPQYLERIFGLGERLHSISKYPGNGIGLATCQKIVQRHGGHIRAESPGLGHGATFSFSMPAAP